RIADAEALAEERTDHSDLAEQYVIETLIARIHQGELAPGEPIPSQTNLMRTYGLSRGGVRTVITTLRDAGLVETVRRRGTFVRQQGIG
ncbi:winged helix-turn-helix domain-containing protein, partial [Streptomyces anulatus]|uniref:winged helix-turn-helix domain-containing protein n=1 Tax=Streptomyces anulatus TaxID=1892 RepID=UPI0034433C75